MNENAIRQAYGEGFIAKCAQYNVNPQLLAEMALGKDAQFGWLQDAGKGIANAATSAGKGIAGSVVNAGKQIGQGAYDVGAGAVNLDPKRMASGAGNVVGGTVGGVGDLAQQTVEGTTGVLGSMAQPIPGIGGAVNAVGNTINQAGGAVTDTLKNTAGVVQSGTKGDLGGMGSNAAGMLTAPVQRLMNTATNAAQIPSAIVNPVTAAGSKGVQAAQNKVNSVTGQKPLAQPAPAAQPTLPAATPFRTSPTPAAKPAPAPAPAAAKIPSRREAFTDPKYWSNGRFTYPAGQQVQTATR